MSYSQPQKRTLITKCLWRAFNPFYKKGEYPAHRKFIIHNSKIYKKDFTITVTTRFVKRATSIVKDERNLTDSFCQEIIDCLNDTEHYHLVNNCWISNNNSTKELYISYGIPNLTENFKYQEFKEKLNKYWTLKTADEKRNFIGGMRKYFSDCKKTMLKIFSSKYTNQYLFKYFNGYHLSHNNLSGEEYIDKETKKIAKTKTNKKILNWTDEQWIDFCDRFIKELELVYELLIIHKIV